ncbi:MAG: hypothetical protein OHK0012_06450 [Synechococcales cyanobacterium]
MVAPLVRLVQNVFQGLFQRPPRLEVEVKAPTQEFFLDPDDAKTLGNIEYMRTLRTVRKTFPKMVGTKKETLEIIESISASEKVRVNQPEGESATPPVGSSAAGSAEPAVDLERRRADNSLDLFRSMARDLNK